MSTQESASEQLQAIRDRLKQATAGPWAPRNTDRLPVVRRHRMPHGEAETFSASIFSSPTRVAFRLNFGYGYAQQEGDALFVAHARQDIPFLLDLVDSLSREIAGLKEERVVAADAAACRERSLRESLMVRQCLLEQRAESAEQQRDELHQQCCQMADAAGERESIAALVADRDEMTVYLKVEALVAEAEAQRDELQRQIKMQCVLGNTASDGAPCPPSTSKGQR